MALVVQRTLMAGVHKRCNTKQRRQRRRPAVSMDTHKHTSGMGGMQVREMISGSRVAQEKKCCPKSLGLAGAGHLLATNPPQLATASCSADVVARL